MRRNLQSKFQWLGISLILFALLMVPMFNQVKADTRDSLKEAKNTWMSKMFREISRDFKPKNLENTEVEDYWAEQAKKQDPNCGEACDPNADRDGDGVSNGDEVRQGRNPSCNEDKEPHAGYCKDQDPYNLTEPDPTVERVERTMVAHLAWRFSSCSAGPVATGGNCGQPLEFNLTVPENATLLQSYFNATNYQGTGFSLVVRNNNVQQYQHSGNFAPSPQRVTTTPQERATPPPGVYTAQLNVQAGTQSGEWELKVWATHVVK